MYCAGEREIRSVTQIGNSHLHWIYVGFSRRSQAWETSEHRQTLVTSTEPTLIEHVLSQNYLHSRIQGRKMPQKDIWFSKQDMTSYHMCPWGHELLYTCDFRVLGSQSGWGHCLMQRFHSIYFLWWKLLERERHWHSVFTVSLIRYIYIQVIMVLNIIK